MSDFYPATPTGKKGEVKVGYPPAKVALVSWNRENAAASSIMLLGHDTTEIEVAAIANTGSILGMAGKWLSQSVVDSSVAGTSVITAAGTANYDFVVPGNQVRRFVVPIVTNVQSSGSVMGVNRKHGLFPALAVKTLSGNASVLVAEF